MPNHRRRSGTDKKRSLIAIIPTPEGKAIFEETSKQTKDKTPDFRLKF
jgi:hypothetical protein